MASGRAGLQDADDDRPRTDSSAPARGGGNPGPQAWTVRDDAGRTLTLPAPATRVISLIPAQTGVIAILAGPDVLIARTQWDDDPRLQHLPGIGNALTPSVEWLAAQRPDLVIAWPDAQSRDVVQRLSDVGIPVYASRVESIDDIRSMIERLGVLLGVPSRADSLNATIAAELDAVRARVAARRPPRVLYLLNVDPPMAAGGGTYVDELVGIANAENVFGDLRQPWPQVSLEEIIRRAPDIIIRPSESALSVPLAGLGGRPGWRELSAVREGRVHAVDPNLFNRPGADVGTAAARLAELIHPDSTWR
jgi:iron complex transport system substrate-binding protein